MTKEHKPTVEQQAIIDANCSCAKVVAYAGCGKTAVLCMRAETHPERSLYLAFNKSVQVEAEKRFPKNVTSVTGHALAYRAIITRGGKYVMSKYGNLSMFNTAKLLRLDYYWAALVNKTIENFCASADNELSAMHVEPDWLGRYTYDISQVTLDNARQIWGLLVEGRDPNFQMTHSVYLKLFQLSKPKLGYDTIMLDEAQDCQPDGSLVDTPTGKVKIESLQVGDEVISYTQKALRLRMTGSRITSLSRRPYAGTLLEVKTESGRVSRYTPGHICLAKVGPAFAGKTILYLMRKGQSWRIGITSANHGKNGRESGIAGRLREENADAIWVLSTFSSKKEARMAEVMASAKYSIPELTFIANGYGTVEQGHLDRVWAEVGDITDRAEKCLVGFNRDIRYPLATRRVNELGNRCGYLLYSRASTVRACNLLDGMQVIDASCLYSRRSQKHQRVDGCWTPITVNREHYSGQITSLAVAGDNTYVADSIATHNCNPVMHDIVFSQSQHGARIILVGDGYQQVYAWRGAIDALDKVQNAETFYLTQSFRFGKQVANVANHILNAFFHEDRPLVGLGSEGEISTTSPVGQYTFLSRTNAFLFAKASTLAGKARLFVPGRDSYGNLPIFNTINDIYAMFQGGEWKRNVKQAELKHFQDYNELVEFCETGMADPEWNVSVAMVEKYRETIPAQIQNIKNSLVNKQEDADVTLITAHRSKGLEWDQVVLEDDYAELFDDNGKLRPFGDCRKTEIAQDEVNLLYVAATRAKKRLTVNKQLFQLLAFRGASGAVSTEPPKAPAIVSRPIIEAPVQEAAKNSEDVPF